MNSARARPPLGLLAVLVLACCAGCGSAYAVRHTVESGDTVSAVARRYRVSEAELRRFNRLEKNDQLRLGDLIFIPGARTDSGREAPGPPPGVGTPAAPPGAIRAAPVTPTPPPPAATSPSRPVPRPVGPAAALAWPAAGEVLRGFGSGPAGDSQGIDIAAAAGAAVHAAGDGMVTYAGEPSPAYGTIVIVEHPGKLFSVYSQLASASLNKGERVSRGQALGRVAAGKPSHLHFEVRREERAVDPLLFLPPR